MVLYSPPMASFQMAIATLFRIRGYAYIISDLRLIFSCKTACKENQKICYLCAIRGLYIFYQVYSAVYTVSLTAM